MPVKMIRKGASAKARRKHASQTISEFRHGKTFAKTARKFGKKRAQAQAVAVGMRAARMRRRHKR
jgi:hypothetical protein